MRVRCEAVRYFPEPQPGMIEAFLTDASGFRWQIVEKTAMFHEWASLTTGPANLPSEVSLDCRIEIDRGESTVFISLESVGDRLYEVDRGTLVEQ